MILGTIHFTSPMYPTEKKDQSGFKKQIKTFKKMNKAFMKRLKNGIIPNLSYNETEDKNGGLDCSWTWKKPTVTEELQGAVFFSN